MCQLRSLALCLAALLAGAGLLQADTAKTPSPLRLIPAEADLLFEVKDPRRLVDLGKLDIVSQLLELDAVKEQLGSTTARRGRQLLAYFEKSLGEKWPGLLDRLAGGGVAVGLKVGPSNPPLVMVIQGKDEKLMEQFVHHAIVVLEGELARQESKDTVQKGDYKGIAGYHVGKTFFLARVGAALVFSNHKEAMAKALDLHLDKDRPSLAGHKGVLESDRLLPENYLARAWLNMRPIQDSPQGKELYKAPRDNGALTVLFGAYLDLLGRTPYICSALAEEKDGYLLTVRAPAGKEGMGPDRELHLPPDNEPGSRPLLEPKGVLYSSSFYLDSSRIWKDRAKLFPKVQADGITEFDKNSGRFLAGIRLSALLEAAGPYHRIVVVNQSKVGYKKEPRTRYPAFAFISELREAEKFGRSMDTLLRAAALFTSQQFQLKLAEEKHSGQTIVGYRFNEKSELKQDTDDVRFNFSPCFARVGGQFIFCSTIELCRELVDLLLKEQKEPGKSAPSNALDRYYAAGLADLLRDQEDSLVLQTILDRATPPKEAKKQVEQLIALTRSLGATTTQVRFEGKQTRYDVHIRLGKK